MGENPEENSKPFDPFGPLRGMRDAYLEALSKTMIEAVNSEGYTQATGVMLDGYLTASAPFREALEKSMIQALQQLSLPSRQEVAVLADRFTNLEMRLDDIDAKLDRIARVPDIAQAKRSADAGEPPRQAFHAEPVKPRPVRPPAAAKRTAGAAKPGSKRNTSKSGR